ncbi:hypothetical protein P43SY_007205 [Pythium insidiosum]|uniref:Uncharacterized protein n=1 Tax=Pythium insidiosum TaxID=114742 RepID=A0AAD5Q8X2_PYTIN|nr:hypothetical protein P43SY_007205 [Pythium insidiosum]
MQASATTKQTSSRSADAAPCGPTLAAGQTFRSIFGDPLALQESLKMRVKAAGEGTRETIRATTQEAEDIDDDMSAWDDPFSTDGGGSAADDESENNNSVATSINSVPVPVPQLQHAHSEDMSVERIVAEARRLQFLEAYFQRNEGSMSTDKGENSAIIEAPRPR